MFNTHLFVSLLELIYSVGILFSTGFFCLLGLFIPYSITAISLIFIILYLAERNNKKSNIFLIKITYGLFLASFILPYWVNHSHLGLAGGVFMIPIIAIFIALIGVSFVILIKSIISLCKTI